MTDSASNPRQTMWQMLAHTIVENIDSSHLDRILGMVKKNLTFDDPGLFSTKILEDGEERVREQATNSWLLNQLTYSLSICGNAKLVFGTAAVQQLLMELSPFQIHSEQCSPPKGNTLSEYRQAVLVFQGNRRAVHQVCADLTK